MYIPLALQTMQHRLAELKTEICIGRAFLDNCIAQHNEQRLDSQQASMAKYWSDKKKTILMLNLHVIRLSILLAISAWRLVCPRHLARVRIVSIRFRYSLCFRCTDLQQKVATQCLQMHGGWGYMWEYPIARAFVDSRVQPIYGGSNEIMKELIARAIISDK